MLNKEIKEFKYSQERLLEDIKELHEFKYSQDNAFDEWKKIQENGLHCLSSELNSKLNSLIIDTREKTRTADIVKMIENKPDIQDINKALMNLQIEIDKKFSVDDYSKFVDENSVILNTL